MSTYDDLAQRYIDAWNETDPTARRAAVDPSFGRLRRAPARVTGEGSLSGTFARFAA